MDKVNIAEKLGLIKDYWSPRIAGELNDSYLKLVKLKGEFVWHHHDSFAAENTPENMALYLAEAFSPEKQARELVILFPDF